MSKLQLSEEKLKKQELKIKKLKKELKNVSEIAGIKKINAINTNENDYIFQEINIQKNAFINKIILDTYLQIDSKLNILIANFFFGHLTKDYESSISIINSSKYRVFSNEILMEMPFMRKVSILKQVINIPKGVMHNINKVNDLRNAITHTLIPQNLKGSRTLYNKKNIYKVKTIKKFIEDSAKTESFLYKLFIEGFEKDIYNKIDLKETEKDKRRISKY